MYTESCLNKYICPKPRSRSFVHEGPGRDYFSLIWSSAGRVRESRGMRALNAGKLEADNITIIGGRWSLRLPDPVRRANIDHTESGDRNPVSREREETANRAIFAARPRITSTPDLFFFVFFLFRSNRTKATKAGKGLAKDGTGGKGPGVEGA